MKTKSMLLLCAMLALMPLGASAEALPEVLGAVSQGLSEGFAAMQSESAAPKDLSLTLSAQEARIEEGHCKVITITAENPYPQEMSVELTLRLPTRLSCAQSSTWNARLPAAQEDPDSGKPIPSVTTFTREITLIPGTGASEPAPLEVEMGMGTRFYRAQTTLNLCVPHISASAEVDASRSRFISPGDVFDLRACVTNDGAAPKDVSVSLVLPEGISPAGSLPDGFSFKDSRIAGTLRAEAASSKDVLFSLQAAKDALAGDSDASRLLAPVLTVDGKRIPSPMLRIVGPNIHASLIPEANCLKEGEMMDLAITVVNTGLSEAQVELACRLPEGLHVVGHESAARLPRATAAEAEDALPPGAAAKPVMSSAETTLLPDRQDGTLIYTLHMDAAKETDEGVAASTKEIHLRIRADVPLEDVKDRLLGASLVWRTDGGEPRLSEAAALRILSAGPLGLSHSEWTGILLAALLMTITVCCLYSAVKSGGRQDDYCFE